MTWRRRRLWFRRWAVLAGALALLVAQGASARVTVDYKRSGKTLKVTVHTSVALKSKLVVYWAVPCGGKGREIHPAPGRPSRVTLTSGCYGNAYLGVDQILPGKRDRNLITKKIPVATTSPTYRCTDLRVVPKHEFCSEG